MPLAPPWFSMTTGWPQRSLSIWAIGRAVMSAPPPGGYGTTMRIALFG
ncbi:MAG TPA: hypothetical protein VGJ65_19575 [Albitalea sp.]